MRCQDIMDSLSAYIDGMLDSSAASRVEEHLKSCNCCRTEYEELLATVELVRDLPDVSPPPGFRDGLHERMRNMATGASAAPRATRSLFKGRWMGVMAAAAVLFLTVGVTALWYEKQGGIPFPGSETRIAGDQLSMRQEVSGQTNQVHESARNSQTNDTAVAVESPSERAMNIRENSVAAQEAPAVPSERRVPAAGTFGREDTYAGAALEDGAELLDGGIMSEPPPPPTGEAEAMLFIAADPGSERAAKEAAPPGLGAGPLQAVEHSITLSVKGDVPVGQIEETVTQYGGYMEKASGAATLVCNIPFYNAESFINELPGWGQVVERKTNAMNLAPEINKLESQLAELLDTERALIRQLTHKGDRELERELAVVGEKIAGLQAELDSLNDKAAMAVIRLHLTHE